MAAVFAISHDRFLVEVALWVKFGHPLPWVLGTVHENSVGSFGVVPCEFSEGSVQMEVDSEDILAVVNPVLFS